MFNTSFHSDLRQQKPSEGVVQNFKNRPVLYIAQSAGELFQSRIRRDLQQITKDKN